MLVRLKYCAWVCLVALLLLSEVGFAEAPPRMLWGPASELRSLAWSRPDMQPTVPRHTAQRHEVELWRVHDPRSEVLLGSGRLLLVPIRLGDIVEVSGTAFQPAFVYGSLEEPDALVWHPPEVGRAVIRVPTWGYPRFLGVRVEDEQLVRVRVAVPTRDQLAFHRLDGAIQEVLADRGRPTPTLPDGEGQDLLDALIVQRDIVLDALSELPGDRRAQLERASVSWLAARWLAESYSVRPLLRPYFRQESIAVTGGTSVPYVDGQGQSWHQANAGGVLTFESEADVLRFSISVWAGEDARYQIFGGDELVAEQVRLIPERSMIEDRWTPPKASRVVLRGGGPTRIIVLEGRVRVDSSAVAAQVGLFEAGDFRSPAALLDAALRDVDAGTEPAAQMLRLLALDERLRSDESARRLRRLLQRERRPRQRALLWSALLPRFAEDESIAAQILDFWKASSALSEDDATKLRHWVLRRIHEARDVPPVEPAQYESVRGQLMVGVEQMDAGLALTHRALVELLLPPTDGMRPSTAAELEVRAASMPFRADHRRLARSLWRRASPWSTLDVDEPGPGELRWRTPRPEVGAELCDVEGPVGMRWTRLSEAPQSFDISPKLGTHVSVPMRPLPTDGSGLSADSKVDISGTATSVLVVPAQTSRVLLDRGQFEFSVPRGPPVVARIPRQGQAACDTLLEARRWHELAGKVTLPLPPGTSVTVASVVVERDSVPLTGARLTLRAGPIAHRAEIRRPATGAPEIAIPPGVSELELESDAPLLVRVRVRQHRSAPSKDVPERALQAGVASPRLVKLDRLRLLARESRKLQSVAALSRLRTRRANLLLRLGYRSLAETDAARRVPGSPSIGIGALPPNEVWLPHREEHVIAASRATRLPLMPPDLSESELQFVHDKLLSNQDQAALHALAEAAAEQARGRGAQAMAILLEQAGELERAAELYEALSDAVPAAENFAAAAEMRTAQARVDASLELTERAHFLARQATALGARDVRLLAPLSDTVRWQTPSLSSLGQGVVRLDVRGENPRAHSEASQLRAALTDKPDESRWLSKRSALNLFSLRGKRLRVTSLCFLQQGPLEACRARLELDGVELACEAEPEQRDLRLATVPHSCDFDVPDGARRLRLLLPPAGDAVGWYVVHDTSGAEPSIVPAVHSFSRISPESPLQMQVMAPTVVRVRVRARGEEPASVDAVATASVFGTQVRGEVLGAAQRWHVPLLDEIDPYVSMRDSDVPVQHEVSEYLVVEGEGLRSLSITPSRAGVFIKPELPVVVSPPAPEELPVEEVGARLEPIPWSGFAFPTPAEPEDGIAVTLSGDVTVVDRDLAESDVDARDRHVELLATVRHELLERRLWASLGVFSRMRDGPSSYGIDIVSSLGAGHYVPGAYVRGRVVGQRAPNGVAIGARATLGLFEAVPISSRWTFLPAAALTVRHSDRSMLGERGSDRDVASIYADSRALSLDLGSTFSHRPYYDTRGRYAAVVRLNPDLASVDRAQVGAQVDWVGGSGWSPWLRWDTSFGYRPQNELRDVAFFRLWTSPSATIWRWLVGGGRVRVGLSLGSYIDFPLDSPPVAFFGALGVGYDFMGAEGLTHHRPLERMHRSRQEEGSRKVNTAPPASDTFWAASPEQGDDDPEEGP